MRKMFRNWYDECEINTNILLQNYAKLIEEVNLHQISIFVHAEIENKTVAL